MELTVPPTTCGRFDNIGDLGDITGAVLWRKEPIMTGLDYFISVEFMFQTTVSPSHAIKFAGLNAVFNACMDKQTSFFNGSEFIKPEDCKLAFKQAEKRLFIVVPEDIYDDKKAFKNRQRITPESDVTQQVNAIEQYVLRMPSKTRPLTSG